MASARGAEMAATARTFQVLRGQRLRKLSTAEACGARRAMSQRLGPLSRKWLRRAARKWLRHVARERLRLDARSVSSTPPAVAAARLPVFASPSWTPAAA
eukprot:6213050-Alexandrium_andersonii.AAC.1